jgi:F-type H+-transporting ATPase subunit delta
VIGGGAVSRRYARALFTIGNEGSGAASAEGILEGLESFVAAAEESSELAHVLFTPIHPRKQRIAVAEEIAQKLELTREVRAFLSLLLEENRASLLQAIAAAMREMVEEAAGRVRGVVTSARPLEDAELERLRSALSARAQADVILETRVDPELIGGVVARVGDLLFDGSVRTQLESLRESLRKGN